MFTLHWLGPVLLRRGGVLLPLTVQKAQALLLMLAGQGLVPRERVATRLWPQLDESTARRNLRRELARLRDAGAHGLVEVQGDFLSLAAGTRVDALEFEAALAAGQPDAALTLWSGTPADGLRLEEAGPFDEWLAHERVRLQGLRAKALQLSAEVHEAQQAFEAALRRVEALLEDDPLQEQHHRSAMRLLAALGRREAALAQYERCQRLLADELGLAPMEATRALADSLRTVAATPAATPASSGPAAPEPDSVPTMPRLLPFVGRRAEVQALEAAWARGVPLLLEGEGGIGKTRLATDFAAAHGPYALVQARAGDAELPYAVFTRALRALAGGDAAFADLPPWVRTELSRLLPELGAPPTAVASAEERARLLDACARAWLALAEENFDAVLIDDWHLADAASQALLTQVAQRRADAGTRGAGGARVMLLFRPELGATGRQQVQALRSGAAALHLVLQPLPQDEVLFLVRQLSGSQAPERFARRLERATGGNPFFIGELLRHGVDSGWLRSDTQGAWQTAFDASTQDYRELPLPASVRDAVLGRSAGLPEAARRVLDAAALAVEPWQPALLAAACALSEIETSEAIEQGLQAQLLREHERGGYAFAHDLVQQALESALSPGRRRLLHRRLALGAEAAMMAPALTAQHWEAAGEPARAVTHRIAAAEAAARLLSEEAALAQWQAALDAGPTPAQRLRVLMQRWLVLRSRGDKPGMEATLGALDEVATQLAADPGQADAIADAALQAASICSVVDRCAESLQRLDALLPTLRADDVQRRARTLEVRALALGTMGRLSEGLAAAESAMALGGLEPIQTARLLDMLAYQHYVAGRPGAALPIARRALALWEALHVPRWTVRGYSVVGTLLGMVGDIPAAEAELEKARVMALSSGLPEQARESMLNLMNFATHQGHHERVLQLADEAIHLGAGFTRRHRQAACMMGYHVAHAQRGDLGLALKHADEVQQFLRTDDEPGMRADVVSTLLGLPTALHDHARVHALLARVADAPEQEVGYFAAKLAFARAGYEVLRGDLAAARAQLRRVGERGNLQQPEDRGLWDLRSAQIALAEGDPARALELTAEWPATAPTVELRAGLQVLRLRAARKARRLTPTLLEAADAALASGRLPAVDAWALQRECARAAAALNDVSAARREAQAAAALQQLGDSLVDYPDLRVAWLRVPEPA